MSAEPTDVVGLILAGGASRRFGRDKLLEDLHGEPLLAHAIRRVAEVASEIHVVVPPDDPLPRLPADLAVDFVRDVVEFEGPLRALAHGLAFLRGSWAIVAGGDMPDLQPAVLEEMVRAARETGATVVALSDAGEARPLPIVVRVEPTREAADRLLESDHRRLRDLLAEVETVVVDEPSWAALDPDRRTLFDVDEPSDLEG